MNLKCGMALTGTSPELLPPRDRGEIVEKEKPTAKEGACLKNADGIGIDIRCLLFGCQRMRAVPRIAASYFLCVPKIFLESLEGQDPSNDA